MENGDNLIQLFLQYVSQGHTWRGEEGKSYFSSMVDFYFYIDLLYIFSPQLKNQDFFLFLPPLSRPIIGPALPPGFREASEDTRSGRCFVGPSVSSESRPQVCEK